MKQVPAIDKLSSFFGFLEVAQANQAACASCQAELFATFNSLCY
jgi:hypothetical protein